MFKKDLEREEAKRVTILKINQDQDLDRMKKINLNYLKKQKKIKTQ